MPKDKKNVIQTRGRVEEALPGLLFRIILEETGNEVLAHLSGKMKLHRISVIPGDTALVEMTTMNERRGRIVRRL